MIKWKNILKSNQINIGSTTLDTRNLPEEDDDKGCCEEAYDAWLILCEDVLEEYRKEKKATRNSIAFWAGMLKKFSFTQDTFYFPKLEENAKSCQDFFGYLDFQLSISKDYYYKYNNRSSLLPNFYVPRLRKILQDWEKCDPEKVSIHK
jgi:hypothetical protein